MKKRIMQACKAHSFILFIGLAEVQRDGRLHFISQITYPGPIHLSDFNCILYQLKDGTHFPIQACASKAMDKSMKDIILISNKKHLLKNPITIGIHSSAG